MQLQAQQIIITHNSVFNEFALLNKREDGDKDSKVEQHLSVHHTKVSDHNPERRELGYYKQHVH